MGKLTTARGDSENRGLRRVLIAAGLALGLLLPAVGVPAQEGSRLAPTLKSTPRPDYQADRLRRLNAAKSWGYQLMGMSLEDAAKSPYDLLVVDATQGIGGGRAFTPEEVARLRKKPDGSPRIVVSYISIGESEDYRAEYFTKEYLEEDFPDWLLHENKDWKGNRIIKFCSEGWQRTIIGDDQGNSVYNSIEKSPLHKIVDLGFDGVYLDRVDVYAEVGKLCTDGARQMVDFVARLAASARRRNPQFIVIQQNAEELLKHKKLMDTIDAIAKEDLFYGADHSQNPNSAGMVSESIANLKLARAAGRPVFVIDYVLDAALKADARKRIEQQGFIAYLGPRDLARLWLPGKDF